MGIDEFGTGVPLAYIISKQLDKDTMVICFKEKIKTWRT